MFNVDQLAFSRGGENYNFNLAVQQGEFVGLYGPSGIGKSTLLDLIAGFESPSHGKISLGKQELTNLPIEQRPVTQLFQQDNLFPHFTGFQNIAIGICNNLKLNGSQHNQVIEVAKQLQISAELDKKPEFMSGGQKQRVALARCLVRNKPLLLLDEPFSALDKALRNDCLALVKQLQQTHGWTVLLVSHQPEEVAPFADRLLDFSELLG